MKILKRTRDIVDWFIHKLFCKECRQNDGGKRKELLSILSFIGIATVGAILFVYTLAHNCGWEC